MDLSIIDKSWTIDRLEWGKMRGERPRNAGSNARLGVHGKYSSMNIVRVTIAGVTGFGNSFLTRERAEAIIGKRVLDFFGPNGKVVPEYRTLLEFPLLDWLGQVSGKPVYELVADPQVDRSKQLIVPCYDTSLYFDDLHLQDDRAAVQLLQEEALQGKDRGHRHFKIKVARGARHMTLMEGTKRDIAIVNGIREVAGPDAKIMIDANNGYNLNLTKDVLKALADADLYWIEEAFHEDPVLYKDLKEWMAERQLRVRIADGEGLAASPLVDWAVNGLVDVLQYDIIHPGFTHWLELGTKLDRHQLLSAPHSYGNAYGNYAAGHLASAIKGFKMIEWDEASVEGIDTTGYKVEDGNLYIPDAPGFGLVLDASYFQRLVKDSGWEISGL